MTVIAYDEDGPTQVLSVGVTVIKPINGPPVVFIAVNPGTLPAPLAPKPIAGVEFVQANVPPTGLVLIFVAGTGLPLHTIRFAGTVSVGVGFTVIV